MYFKKIEMHGFKSFADPVVIEFDRGITCIVGPNGSGKSNISDAIRWVLGEQSPKMLRGGKMEEVIFAGTAGRKSRGMAEVTLVIDNEEGILPIDYKEVAITRRMFRSGESEYHINGNQCRLRDIRELIMDTGIGVDGYSIIGQGKIAEILSNKTESRREIFEEAAGIVLYRTKKAESERKLASAGANMERVKDIIGEIEGRIDGLREDSIKAKEYIGLRDRYKELEINITLKNIESLENKTEELKEDLSQLEADIRTDSGKKTELEKLAADCSSRNEALDNAAAQTREKLMTAVEELNSAVSREEVDKARLAAAKENSESLKAEIARLCEKAEKETITGRQYAETRSQLDKKLEAAKELLGRKIEAYNQIADEMAGITAQIDKYKNDIFEASGRMNSGKAEISSLQRLQETLDKRRASLLEEKNSGDDNNKETIDRLNSIRRDRDKTAEGLEEIKDRITSMRESCLAGQHEEKQLTAAAEELRISLGRLSARQKTIEEMESNYEGYNFAVKHVMKSGLKGIHGVVAELISVPSGYETAVETALGASLQNIVCEDDDSAKSAIISLKQNKAGRMTFLPVSSVRGKAVRDSRLENASGFIGFGPDCVDFDNRYTNIIDYLLGRVVLVDSMDNAVRMSKLSNGFRFVTLEGEVINAGGAITGGKYRNKTANILDRKAEITALKNEIDNKTVEYRQHEDRLRILRKQLEDYLAEISELQENQRNTEHELIAADNEIKLAENLLREIKTGGDKLDRELSSIEAEKVKSQEMIGEINERISGCSDMISAAEKACEELMSRHSEMKQQFEAASEEITAARISVNSCENEKTHADSMVERIEASCRELREDIDSKQQQLDELTEEKEKLISGSGSTGSIIREKELEKQELEEYLRDVSARKSEISAELSRVSSERENVEQRLEAVRSQKYELEIKKAKNETQLDTYKNKLWEDFEISYIQAMEFKSADFVMSAAVKENREIKNRMKALGEVNIGAIEEYETVKERYEFLTGQREDIQQAVNELTSMINDMDNTIKVKFKESFDKIVVNFEEKFRELFGGGHAELRLSDENNPLESNIDIVAQPPGKKLQNINLLSGGEKTLTAIALMFAVLKAKPAPFCILDEVEAALDDANIDRFISVLRKFSGIQFALVTHQKSTMEHADVLYGVTMPEKGVSKVLSLSMDDDFEI
ncbi:MAG: chromosome segregation protein SMC [Bacillota bacterium]|nr:chromosome segregation protein SMC [Bacillota bacterium]